MSTPVKGILEFDLSDPEGREGHELACSARNMQIALSEIADNIFRKARKHGYSNPAIADLFHISETMGYTTTDSNGDKLCILTELVWLLEREFYEILDEYKVNLD